MSGYTRQSTADIINGAEITAPPLNAEFNTLADAFSGSTGHAHDGSTGNGPPINLATSVSGYLPAVHGGAGGKNNFAATSNPTSTSDVSQGYAVGSMWFNTTTSRGYICTVNTINAAVWNEVVTVRTGNAILPASTASVDLGSSAFKFKNLFISGAIDISTLSATGVTTGTITTSGAASLASMSSSLVDIDGGTIDGTVVGGTSAQTVRGTVVTATTNFAGPLTGNVTGNVTGNITGNVTGNVTGDLTGNVNAASGTSTFQEVTINGTLNLNSGSAGTITGLSAPTSATDAATKSYVDTAISNLVNTAPGTLDTLNELATALGNDPNFATTMTTELAKKLDKTGGAMTGAIAMGSNKITGLGTPTATADATTKTYVDTADALKLDKAGGTMTGAIAMSGNAITGLGTPSSSGDATTKGYVDGILGSATSAATSAGAAATSAVNASTSESNAAASATAAANSYDSFDDRYLGVKTANPTVDNDGSALLVGALYFNSTIGEMRVWNGSAWVAAYVPAATYVTKSGDTMTGVLNASAGLTATTGTFSAGASFGDSISVTGVGTFTSNIFAGASSVMGFTGRARITSPADGVLALRNDAQTGFSRVAWGAASASNPAIARTGNSDLALVLGDNTGNANLTMGALTATTGAFSDTVSAIAPNASAISLNLRGRASDNVGYIRFQNNAASSTFGWFGATAANTIVLANAAGTTMATFNAGALTLTGGLVATTGTFSGNILTDGSISKNGANFASSVGYSLLPSGTINLTANGNPGLYVSRLGDDGTVAAFYRGTSWVGAISVTATATVYSTTSDYRLKENVEALTGALDRVMLLRPKRFSFVSSPDSGMFDGFLAHEVAEVVPEAVTGAKDAMKMAYFPGELIFDDSGNVIDVSEVAYLETDKPEYQAVDASKLMALSVAATQELKALVEAHAATIAVLEARLAALEA